MKTTQKRLCIGTFDSRSFGTTGFRPVLTLTVPEPSTFALSLTGLVLALGWRRFARTRG